VQADHDNDGITDFAVLRESNGTWYVLPSSKPGSSYAWTWDVTYGDEPVPGDYNGDGCADWAYWRPSDGTWHINYNSSFPVTAVGVGCTNSSNFAYYYQWGQNLDVPVAADYDGDWLTDLAVWRPSTGTWFTTYSKGWTTGSTVWGQSGDFPIEEPAAMLP
jgi:hypothetical protein